VLFNGLCAIGELKSAHRFNSPLLGALKASRLTVQGFLLGGTRHDRYSALIKPMKV
jgi:hypothetical protein